MFGKKKRMQEDEIPRSVLKMKQEKERREREERRNQRSGKHGKRFNDIDEQVARRNKHKGKIKGKDIDDFNKPKKKKLKKLILFLILIALIIFGISLGVSAHNWKELVTDMFNNKNSIVVNTDGNTIAELGSEQKKLTVDYEDMPENLVNAYVSIEDERFYNHHGVDIRRTASAIGSYIIHFGHSSYGGSTITQQLVKNLTGDTTDSITRKVKEWWKAFLLESYYSKEEILEMYLNVIYVGPNIYGVQTGAKYYFDKDVSDLSLAECAFLAGINNSPNSYNPFGDDDNSERITNRTLTVLQKMLELEYIDQSQYDKAEAEVNSGLDFDQGEIETGNTIYSYHTDALISELITDFADDKNISEEFAQNYLYMSGSTIHSTQDSDIQDEVEYEFNKNQYILYSSDGESTSQAAMVIIDHSTGNVVAVAGGLGEKDTFRGLNRATQSLRQTGSAIKPLAVLAPGIDKKEFTASTIYDDEKKTFSGNYSPGNNDGYLGRITVRRALESSQNIPFVEMMEKVTPSRAISYLEDMGITSLTEEDESLALALGGLQNGITPFEMAGAYATIANDGKYIEPTFYTTVTNTRGKTVLKSKQEKKTVFSKQVAYVLKELLKQPVEGTYGTATYCRISGIDVAAKTGTTDENYDKWLCGFTPYYTAVTWFGFDQNESIYYNNQNPAGIIWANVMRNIHNGLSSKIFEQPSWITTETICADTGMIARTGCKNTYEEYFLWGTAPDECTKHSGSRVNSKNSSNNSNQSDVFVDDDEDLELDPTDQTKDTIVENTIDDNEIESEVNDNEITDTNSNSNTVIDEPENIVEDEPTIDEPAIDDSPPNTGTTGNTIDGGEETTTPPVDEEDQDTTTQTDRTDTQ